MSLKNIMIILSLGYSATVFGDSVDWYHVNFTAEKATASSVMKAKKKPEDYYGVHKALDGKVETAWCSNAHGSDIKDESIEFEIKSQATNGVYFLPGFGKNMKLFKANNRISKARITVTTAAGKKLEKIVEGNQSYCLDYREDCMVSGPDGFQDDAKCIDKLKCQWDSNFYTGLGWDFSENLCINKVKIEILDVIKGNKYDDTCIAEVSFNKPAFNDKDYVASQNTCLMVNE